jgi:hypothetical protein
MAIVLVSNYKHISSMILFNDVGFHINTFILVAEFTFIGIETVTSNFEELIVGLTSSNKIFTVIRDNHANDI